MFSCVFDFLHVAPLVLIALSLLSLRFGNKKLLVSVSTAALSLIGLAAGSHMHTEHFEPLASFDPCYGYALALAVSVAVTAREVISKRYAKNNG